MALSSWKTKKTNTRPKPIIAPEAKTGGGEPSIAGIATIAASTGNNETDIRAKDQAPTDPNTEPVKEWAQRLAFYQTLVRCQQCDRLDENSYCCTVAIYTNADALRACESFKQVQGERAYIEPLPVTARRLKEELERYARPLSWLASCRACCFQNSRYCPDGYALGNAYDAILLCFDDEPSHRDAMLTRIVKTRHINHQNSYR
jgi:hypothetical protein